MPKDPLFSTYRQGENRVTASLMAVFDRIDLSKLERILALESDDSALQLVSFENQIRGGGSGSVPDARISGSFALWFETKTAPGQVRVDQLRAHLSRLGDDHRYERLFLLTPDPDEPEAVRQISDPRLRWISFGSLSQAIDSLLADDRELTSEKEELLLRELQALFELDGLLGDPRQVVVVPAGNAYREYQDVSAYLCQPRRPFKPVDRMAFYCRGRIEREVPRIRHVVEEVEFSSTGVSRLRASANALDHEVAALVERSLAEARRPAGTVCKVFLLTDPGDVETEQLQQPIVNDATDANGRTVAWVMMQRYASLAALRSARRTSEIRDAR